MIIQVLKLRYFQNDECDFLTLNFSSMNTKYEWNFKYYLFVIKETQNYMNYWLLLKIIHIYIQNQIKQCKILRHFQMEKYFMEISNKIIKFSKQ